jgi:DNA-binding Xre family transcriptional regulator
MYKFRKVVSMIVFDRLESLLKSKGKSYYTLRRDKVIGSETIAKVKSHEPGKYIDTRSINRLCEYLDCQPGDFMDYVKEPEE